MPGWITVSWNAPAVDDRMVRTVASCNQQPTLADCNIVTSLNRAPRTPPPPLSPSPAYAPMYVLLWFLGAQYVPCQWRYALTVCNLGDNGIKRTTSSIVVSMWAQRSS